MMKFVITKEKILSLLKNISGVIDRKKQSILLSCVKLEVKDNNIYITGTDQSLELKLIDSSVQVHKNGNVVVPFRQLFEICKTLPSSHDITFDVIDNKLKISTAHTQVTLQSILLEQFPEIQNIKQEDIISEINISCKNLHALLDKTSFAMAEQDVRYYFNGMLFEVKNKHLVTVAADGHRLAKDELALDPNHVYTNVKAIIPRKTIFEIIRIIPKDNQMVNIAISKNHIQLSLSNVLFISSLIDGKFPDYFSVIPEQTSNYFIVHKEPLKEALVRASALFTERFRGVVLNVKNGWLTVIATNSEHDKTEEQLEIEYVGDDMEVAFNISYILDFLSVVESDRVKFTINSNNSSNLLQDLFSNKFCYVLMPVRM